MPTNIVGCIGENAIASSKHSTNSDSLFKCYLRLLLPPVGPLYSLQRIMAAAVFLLIPNILKVSRTPIGDRNHRFCFLWLIIYINIHVSPSVLCDHATSVNVSLCSQLFLSVFCGGLVCVLRQNSASALRRVQLLFDLLQCGHQGL